jgi:hypothetical protein
VKSSIVDEVLECQRQTAWRGLNNSGLNSVIKQTGPGGHEESYDGWQSLHLRAIIAALIEALTEIYVIPKTREKKRQAILDLKSQIEGKKKPT